LTAIVGLGGGVLLISTMPGLLPAAAVVPVHGIVQLASNLSRAGFARNAIDRSIVTRYAAGAVIGAVAAAPLVRRMPGTWLPLLIGSFVLIVTWLPRPSSAVRFPVAFPVLGAIQTFVSLFVGAAGPLSPPVLLRAGLSRDRLVATHAAMMSWMHTLKVATFTALGFAFIEYLPLASGMVVAVILGSWVGTRLRAHVPERLFRGLLRGIVTVLALRLIWMQL
jgi:uncharacterized membrane protein YfcA